jgi:trans-2,3-dihydro-3-hydroxyanthranilate isomerase
LFGPETYLEANDLNVRVFSRRAGDREDPATGSANGCLAAYLVDERYFDAGSVSVRVEQGYEIDRPSLLRLEVDDGRDAGVSVGGAVVPVARGELL